MSELHFSNLDLNLLRVFDALLDERSVTRAGDRLGLTQSAVSHALGRLRHVLGDPLFTRRTGGIEPTPRALEIGPALHTALLQMQAALAPARFDPATTERRFTLMAGPYACMVLAPALVEVFRRQAPRADLQIESYNAGVHEALDAGQVDAAIVGSGARAGRFHFRHLFNESMVWVARAGHPLTSGAVTAQRLAQWPHIIISGYEDKSHRDLLGVSEEIARRSALGAGDLPGAVPPAPSASLRVPDAFSAVVIAGRSDMVAFVPRRLAQMASDAGRVTMCEPPRRDGALEVGALFREDRLAHPALAWLLAVLVEAGAQV